MKIIIATGIFPPAIGGPAEYAFRLREALQALGHEVSVLTYRREKMLPTGIRHLWFFCRCLARFPSADFILALDTYSAALPAVAAAKLLRRKILIRTGGDFLWEWYVERTGDLVLLRHFYETRLPKLNLKERTIFFLTRLTLHHADRLVFSTTWQRELWRGPYRLTEERTAIIENFYGPKETSFPPPAKNFVGATRPLKWKNTARVAEAFRRVPRAAGVYYDREPAPHDEFMDKISHCYAVIVASLGDISPNTVLDAIRYGKPFIVTKETGLIDRIGDIGIFVDPENVDDIAEKVAFLSEPAHYEEARRKIEAFPFRHDWPAIAREFLAEYHKIK